jgi:hypothetical protein
MHNRLPESPSIQMGAGVHTSLFVTWMQALLLEKMCPSACQWARQKDCPRQPHALLSLPSASMEKVFLMKQKLIHIDMIMRVLMLDENICVERPAMAELH